MKRFAVGAALVAFAGASTQAQSVIHGIVRDSASGGALAGSIVQLLGPDTVVGRGLTNGAGRYELRRSGAPRSLEVRHVGYKPRVVPLSSLAPDGTLDVELARLPVQLEPVLVRGNQGCPARADEGRAFALWDQARTGLLAAVTARETYPALMRTLRYDRKIDGGTGQLVRQSVQLGESKTGRPFFAAGDAAQFAAHGYMREDGTGRTYYGPDADVLLDPRFALTHCLSLTPADSAHPSQIGLSFAPSPSTARDTLVDVRGALWLDAASRELKSLEFRFTNLEPAAIEARAGGFVGFRTMTNGVVMINDWYLHLPMLTTQVLSGPPGKPASSRYVPQPFATRVHNGDAMLVEPHDVGGVVTYAEWPDGTKYNAGLATIRGVALLSTTRLPAPHVRVVLDSTPYSTYTDDRGAFEMPGVYPGTYEVMAADSANASLGLRRSRRIQATAALAGSRRVTVDVAPDDEAIDDNCGPFRIGFETILRGRVLNPSGAAAGSTHLRFTWDPSLDDGAPNFTELTTNAQGEFSVCKVPRDRSPRVSALGDHGAHLDARLSLAPDNPVQEVTIRLSPP